MNPFKYPLKPDPKQKVFRARMDVATIKCANCGNQVFKQHEAQIVFFCSRECRRSLRNGKKTKKEGGFRVIEEK